MDAASGGGVMAPFRSRYSDKAIELAEAAEELVNENDYVGESIRVEKAKVLASLANVYAVLATGDSTPRPTVSSAHSRIPVTDMGFPK